MNYTSAQAAKLKSKTADGRYADETYWDRAIDCRNIRNKKRISRDTNQPDYSKTENQRTTGTVRDR